MTRVLRALTLVLVFVLGVVLGGMLFSKSQPRSFLALDECRDRCFSPKDLAGLVASVLVLKTPLLMPLVEQESDTCIAIRHPMSADKVHYVLFPKHDTRNIASLTPDDVPYVMGCMALVRALVERDKLDRYFVLTNGPGLQDVAYLHFHLVVH